MVYLFVWLDIVDNDAPLIMIPVISTYKRISISVTIFHPFTIILHVIYAHDHIPVVLPISPNRVSYLTTLPCIFLDNLSGYNVLTLVNSWISYGLKWYKTSHVNFHSFVLKMSLVSAEVPIWSPVKPACLPFCLIISHPSLADPYRGQLICLLLIAAYLASPRSLDHMLAVWPLY